MWVIRYERGHGVINRFQARVDLSMYSIFFNISIFSVLLIFSIYADIFQSVSLSILSSQSVKILVFAEC